VWAISSAGCRNSNRWARRRPIPAKCFGASVVLEDEHGGEVHYRIVGSDEADAGSGQISVDSPLAQQLMGKLLDDEVRLPLQAGTAVTYWLKDIQYPAVENP